MPTIRWLGTFAVLTALTLAPAYLVLAQQAPPVHVKSCDIVQQRPAGVRRGAVQEVVSVSFTIDGEKAADEATFAVLRQGKTYSNFTARGLFSGGSVIADRIVMTGDPSVQSFYTASTKATCIPTFVHFVDGTTWKSPS